jgi:hypothetical protein
LSTSRAIAALIEVEKGNRGFVERRTLAEVVEHSQWETSNGVREYFEIEA